METPEESKRDKFMTSLSRLLGYCMPGSINSHPGPNNTTPGTGLEEFTSVSEASFVIWGGQ